MHIRVFFFSSRRRHTRSLRDWSSDVCSSDLASFCGCVGLKPTYGLVPKSGVTVLSQIGDHVGPLARTVEDAALVLQVIAGYAAADASSVPVPVPGYSAALTGDVGGLKVG